MAPSARRFLRIGILCVVALIVVVVAAGELFARPRAEDAVAERIQSRYGLTRTPDVSLNGFPFALRGLLGRVPQVDARLADFDYQGLHLLHAEVRLHDVRYRLGTDRAQIGRGEAFVVVGDADFADYLQQFGVRVSVHFEPDRAEVSGRVAISGFSGEVSGSGVAEVDRGGLRIAIDDVSVAGQPVPPAVAALVRSALSFTVPLPRFFDVAVQSVQLRPGQARFALELGPDVLSPRGG